MGILQIIREGRAVARIVGVRCNGREAIEGGVV